MSKKVNVPLNEFFKNHDSKKENTIGKIIDNNKGSFTELPYLAFEDILKVRLFGKKKGYKKYAFENWKNTDEIKDAMFRHLLESLTVENDIESGIDHIAHVAFNALIYLHNKKLKK